MSQCNRNFIQNQQCAMISILQRLGIAVVELALRADQVVSAVQLAEVFSHDARITHVGS